MKRAARQGLITALSMLLIGAAVWGAAWLGGTAEGARWLMNTLSRHTPLAISARTVEGKLFGNLSLGGVRLALAPLQADIEHLHVRWQPLRLLTGLIAAKEMTLVGVAIRDNSPAGRLPDLAWPRVSWAAGLFDAKIGVLRVNGLTYRRLDGQPVSITTLSSTVVWDNASLSLPDLAAVAPSGRVAGSIEAGFLQPLLRVDLDFIPAAPVAGLDALTLQARLNPGRSHEQLTGEFNAAGAASKVKRWELSGEAGMTLQAFNLRRLRLIRPGRRGLISGEGTITPTAGEPLLALQAKAAEIDLIRDTGVAADLSGTLTLAGTPERYRGEFAIGTRGKGWRTAHFSGPYEGNSEGVKLSPLSGVLLDGTLRGILDIRWGGEISLEGTISGRNLNPSRISPDWAGVVNFDLDGNARWPGQDLLRGELNARLLESRLHGQALTGEVYGTVEDGDLRVGRLLLRGKGFALNAAGNLSKRLSFGAEVGDLGRVIPQATGELAADGWVRWHDGLLNGSLSGEGKKLAGGGVRIASARLSARLGEGEESPLHVAATLRNAVYEGFQADSVTLDAKGTALRHTLNAVVQGGGAEARIALSGAYEREVWRGEILRFSGRDLVGPWSLAAPAELVVAADRITLAPLVVTGATPERIEITGELAGKPLSSFIRAAWNGLNLARLNPWLNEVRVAGASDGDIRVHFPEGGPPDVAGIAGARGTLMAKRYGIDLEQIAFDLEGGAQGIRAGMELHTAGGGMLKGGFTSPAPARLAYPETGVITAEWTEIDAAHLRRWLPGDIGLDGRLAGRLAGKLLPGNRLDLTGGLALAGGKFRWQKGGEALAADFHRAELTWGWQGMFPSSVADIDAGRMVASGRVGASGDLTLDGRRIILEQGSFSVDGNERGLDARLDIALAGGGSLKGRFASPKPAGLSIPGEGEVKLEWAGIDAALIGPWLPSSVTLEGRLAGRAAGTVLPERRFALMGDASLAGGTFGWLSPEGEMKTRVRSASLSWEWKGEALRGDGALTLAEYGQIGGGFQLPLPARFPVALDGTGALQASLTAQVREKGLLSALFPGVVRESRGDIDAGLRVGGTWNATEIEGSLKLAGAGAYLPSAGIEISDIRLAVRLEKEFIRIDSFRAVSGPGHIEGTALIRLKGWQAADYKGSITGERFRTVYLPELQILSSPRLRFEGTPEKLAIRGEVILPELIVLGPPTREIVLPSADVILEGTPKPSEKAFPLALDVQVHLALGERVLVKAEGIDAQLGGSVDLAFQNLSRITSRGEIRVVKGRYGAYGADLEIVRGRLFYSGGPINQPTLDILALRTVGDVRAGITAGGLLRSPVIRLYSEPLLPDVDILSYILFGHPFDPGSSVEQAGMMAQMAGALLSRGQSVSLQDQIKNRLGLSTLELQSGKSSGLMGYKQIPTTPATTQAKTADGVSQAMLTVGKYLTPQLYFSYGRSLFTGGNLFRLRYDIFKQWQIETQTGSESGVDLYYKIEFD